MKQQRRIESHLEPAYARRGIVDEIKDGLIHVHDARDAQLRYACCFVRNTGGVAPEFTVGDSVLFALAEGTAEAFVLGVIEPYVPKQDRVAASLSKARRAPSMTTVEDEVVRIKADKGLVIECGKGTIIITEDGKVQIKGTELLSRARGMNKIKGAGIALN